MNKCMDKLEQSLFYQSTLCLIILCFFIHGIIAYTNLALLVIFADGTSQFLMILDSIYLNLTWLGRILFILMQNHYLGIQLIPYLIFSITYINLIFLWALVVFQVIIISDIKIIKCQKIYGLISVSHSLSLIFMFVFIGLAYTSKSTQSAFNCLKIGASIMIVFNGVKLIGCISIIYNLMSSYFNKKAETIIL